VNNTGTTEVSIMK